MALTQSQFLGQQAQTYEPGLQSDRARKLKAAKQAYDNVLQGFNTSKATVNEDYTLGTNMVNAERDKTMPTFQVQRNQADVTAAQKIQDLRNRMANSGLYRSGTTVSDESMFNSQGATQKSGVDTEQNQFSTAIAGRIGDLERAKATQLGDIQGKMNLSGKQYNENTVGVESDYTNALATARGQANNAWTAYDQQVKDNAYREQVFQQQKAEAERAYQMQVQQAQAAAQARAVASRASAARASAPKGFSNSSTASMKNKMDSALANGASVDELLSELGGFEQDGSARLGNYDTGYLKNYLESKRLSPEQQKWHDYQQAMGG